MHQISKRSRLRTRWSRSIACLVRIVVGEHSMARTMVKLKQVKVRCILGIYLVENLELLVHQT